MLALLVGSAQAQTRRRSKKLWVASIAALVAANAFDAYSSRGRYEGNPLLRGPQGHFSTSRGLLIKSGTAAGAILTQALLAKAAPERNLYTASATINFVSAGALSGVAARNLRVEKAIPTAE